MTTEETGLTLDKYFDIVAGQDGDLSDTAKSTIELQKDLAVAIVRTIDNNLIGRRLTTNEVVELESQIENAVVSDDRVRSILDIEVDRNIDRNGANVALKVDSIYGEVIATG